VTAARDARLAGHRGEHAQVALEDQRDRSLGHPADLLGEVGMVNADIGKGVGVVEGGLVEVAPSGAVGLAHQAVGRLAV